MGLFHIGCNSMKLKKSKNAILSSGIGLVAKVYKLIIPFVIRTIFIYTLGSEYLGLNSLFTSIIQVLNVSELGIGTALVFSMYRPIAENDKEKLCALMRLYKIYYRIIGIIVLIMGLIVLPFLPYLITGDIPSDVNLYIIYCLNLGTTVFSYWLFGYRNSLFDAYQKTYYVSATTIIIETIKFILEIIALVFLKNYYYYLIISLFAQILNNIFIAVVSLKVFPDLKPLGVLSKVERKQINKRVLDMSFTKIGEVINNSVDSIVISAVLGLTTLSIYQNYYLIISSLIAIFNIFYQSVVGGIGNSLITDSIQKNYLDFKKVVYILNFLFCFSCCCLLSLYQPFMNIWVNDNSLILDNSFVFLFVIYFFVYEQGKILEIYRNASGNRHKDRFRPLIAASINLLFNFILVQFIGLYGIILSTLISLVFVNVPWLFVRLFSDVFDRKQAIDYLKADGKYLTIIILSCGLSYLSFAFVNFNNDFGNFFYRLALSTLISSFVFIIFTFWQDEFKYFKNLLVKLINSLGKKRRKTSKGESNE